MNSAKILLVEDDKFLRELYTDILENEHYTVDGASDGEEGLRKITRGGYDIVLLDIVLAKVSGIDIMKQVKANPPKNANKCTIFFTNLDDPNQIKEALKFGDDYLIKSQTNPGNLVEKIKSCLAKSAKN